MFSAISFGVFCRCAPSTSAIIRSMNVSPGLEVICTTIRSDSTLVPPVTADRSPPDSRMTGADSPVIADSSTEATPSTTSPSPGMISPASTTTWSPRVSWVPGTSSSRVPAWPGCQPISRRATVSRLVRRSVSAWALPRPSATASARLAKTTVSHSQTTIVQLKTGRRLGNSRVGGHRGADLDHEHDRVAELDPRVQLLERVRGRFPQHLGVEQAATDLAPLGADLAGLAARVRCRCHSHVSAVLLRTGPARARGSRSGRPG